MINGPEGLFAGVAGSPVRLLTADRHTAVVVGASAGALLVLHAGLAWALLPAPVLLAVVVGVLAVVVRRPAPWQDPPDAHA